jgi:hypothetical protein
MTIKKGEGREVDINGATIPDIKMIMVIDGYTGTS